jgi:hypothetical protein
MTQMPPRSCPGQTDPFRMAEGYRTIGRSLSTIRLVSAQVRRQYLAGWLETGVDRFALQR